MLRMPLLLLLIASASTSMIASSGAYHTGLPSSSCAAASGHRLQWRRPRPRRRRRRSPSQHCSRMRCGGAARSADDVRRRPGRGTPLRVCNQLRVVPNLRARLLVVASLLALVVSKSLNVLVPFTLKRAVDTPEALSSGSLSRGSCVAARRHRHKPACHICCRPAGRVHRQRGAHGGLYARLAARSERSRCPPSAGCTRSTPPST